MCLVTIPATYKTVSKRVLVSPETTREVEIPAAFKTVKVRKMVQPAQSKRIPIPAKYQTVTKQNKISEGHMEWRSVLCKTNMTREIGLDIQREGQGPSYRRIDTGYAEKSGDNPALMV
jgi:hypothetical protein